MKNTLKISLIALLFPLCWAIGQNKKTKKAYSDFEDYAYINAIESYESLVNKGHSEQAIFENLGNANYLNANYGEASKWYGKLNKVNGPDQVPEYLYLYAQALKSSGDYVASDEWMKKFQEVAVPGDSRALKLSENETYLEEIEKRSGRYSIKNLALNSSSSDFAPSFNGNVLVFSTAREAGLKAKKIDQWSNNAFLSLYQASLSEDGKLLTPAKIKGKINSITHESTTAFTKDGSSMYFTRNNSESGEFKRDIEGVSRLKIYKAINKNGRWTNVSELPFNDDAYSVSHPALSPDEKKLYFASNMPGTLGQSDIFYVDILEDGSYGAPVNLGNKINTEVRETFPFISQANVLYFSSDGHPGMGGLDVFATSLNKAPQIVNVGKPVNGPADDFSFIINSETRKGYFASNREGGFGNDDIYALSETEPLKLDYDNPFKGTVKDKMTESVLSGTNVLMTDKNGKVFAQGITGADGTFELLGDSRKKNYILAASKEGYNGSEVVFNNNGEQDVDHIGLHLSPLAKEAPVGTDLAEHMNMEPIYFDLDQSSIRKDAQGVLDKLVTYMKNYPQVKIEIGSHTDSKGSRAYNAALSDRRAQETLAYLVNKGIDPLRLSCRGFGESQLINTCQDDVKCSIEEHQVNRRSTFILVE